MRGYTLNRFVVLSVTLLTASSAIADFGQYQSHDISGQTLVIASDVGELRVTAVDDAAFEVHYVEHGVQQLPSFAIAPDHINPVATVTDSDSTLSFRVEGLTAEIQKSPLRLAFLRDGKPLVEEQDGYFNGTDARGFRFKLGANEKILGGGQRVLGMDRRGHRLPLYNKASYGYETHAEQMYYSMPAIMSSEKYMIVFDNSANGWLDIGKTDKDVLAFESVGGRTSYIVVAGDNYPALIENYTDVTGKQPLPPRWAFGNFASRFGYHSEKEVRDVVRRFRRAKIPLDTVIIDIYWFGPDIKGHMGNLDWDRNAFPDPEDMIADFRKLGIKTITVTEPFILTTSDRWQDAVDNEALARDANGGPKTFDFYFGNTGLVDVFSDTARKWFWQPYAMLSDQGIAGTWGDLGEPEVHPADTVHWLSDIGIEASGDEVHNAFGHIWTKMIYENHIARDPDTRPMIMMRSGFAGTQRYGIIPWTGDVKRSWGGLKPQVELGLQGGLFGLAYTHSDLGGFADGEVFDKELYLRWLQYGVFQPVYRPHAQEHIAPEPVFHDRETRRISRDFIRLRYRLLPYIYTLAWENSTTGMPLMRPAFFENENMPWLIDINDAYFWGDAFFVVPVTDPGVESVNALVPPGAWFDFWTDTRYEGGRTADVPVTLETIPVLVRAGSFIPMTPDFKTTADYSSKRLTLHYYTDESVSRSSGRMYEDDGKTRGNIENGRYELLKFSAERDGDYLALKLDHNGSYQGMPEGRQVEIVIHNWTGPAETIRFNSRKIRGKLKKGTLTVTVDWDHGPSLLEINEPPPAIKPVVYQVFTRLFGNKETTNKPWGTIEENGVGKFADFTDAALRGIRELGTTHIWYTGVPHHALVHDYTAYGISNDDPDVIKGRAGSPYSVKDYYSVNPDLAVDPARRVEEFEALIERTHANGMKVIIDIVPNHIARRYESVSRPRGVEDFGASDDTSVTWERDNNFYYIVGEDFVVPEGYVPLNGEAHPLADGQFSESPAKWTGNGSRAARPRIDDWFETAKINFGVRQDGSHAFDRLPDEAHDWSNQELVEFWSQRDVPDSWKKFRDIAHYWLDKGVDGFRYDMAQMVPVEFWSYLNSSIKVRRPDAFLLSEIYVPDMYRDYIALGRMDYLYDKVGLYDAIRAVMQGKADAETIAAAQVDILDIESHMLHFLENHDEQRIASPEFAGGAENGKPGMVVSALIGSSPTMLYFGQDIGEPGAGDAGFGKASRTSIFDYWGVPAHQRWMNDGKFDGGALSDSEKDLRDFYMRLMKVSTGSPAMNGDYAFVPVSNDRLFAFARWKDDERLLVVSNFSDKPQELMIEIPANVIAEMGLDSGRRELVDQLYGSINAITVDHGMGTIHVRLDPFQSFAWRIGGGMFKPPEETPFIDDPEGAHVYGTLSYWEDVESDFLAEQRTVAIWLPPGYEDNPDKRYRVIYMTDGENILDPRIASWGVDWAIDEAMMRGLEKGSYEPAIVVGAWSTSRRRDEYSPWQDASKYARFLTEELMPRVNQEFRTLTGPENTFAMGSSMGGLLSYYLVKNHPETFSACGCVSTHFAFSEANIRDIWGRDVETPDPTPFIVKDIAGGDTVPAGTRFFFDYGTETLDSSYEADHKPVRQWFLQQGLIEGMDFRFEKYEGADHSERAWRARVGDQLEWLLGGG
jgi:oligosaccharide 4-alpha-D-glucosyltransferase